MRPCGGLLKRLSMRYLSLLVLLLIVGCQPAVLVEVETIVATKVGDPSILKGELEQKLEEEGFGDAVVQEGDTAGQWMVQATIDADDIARYNALLQPAHLGFWHTFNISDKIVRDIPRERLETVGFIPYYDMARGYYASEILGVCDQMGQLAVIQKSLTDSLRHIPNLMLRWGAEKIPYATDEVYALYLLRADESGAALISERSINEAFAEQENYTGEIVVQLKFDEQGADAFEDMTTKAAADGNRAIAIVVNDEVFSCPTVNSPIPGGECVIFGNFTMADAEQLAQGIQVEHYSADLYIMDQKLTILEP